MSDDTILRAIAQHETSHALMFLLMENPVSRLSINPNSGKEGSRGSCESPIGARELQETLDLIKQNNWLWSQATPKVKKVITKHILVLVAPCAWADVANFRLVLDGCFNDLVEAYELLDVFAIPEGEDRQAAINLWLQGWIDMAAELLKRPYHQRIVRALSDALVERWSLNAAQIAQVIEDLHKGYRPGKLYGEDLMREAKEQSA